MWGLSSSNFFARKTSTSSASQISAKSAFSTMLEHSIYNLSLLLKSVCPRAVQKIIFNHKGRAHLPFRQGGKTAPTDSGDLREKNRHDREADFKKAVILLVN